MPTDLPDDSCNYITNIGKIIYKQTDKQPKIINNFEYCEKSIITIKESPFDHCSWTVKPVPYQCSKTKNYPRASKLN